MPIELNQGMLLLVWIQLLMFAGPTIAVAAWFAWTSRRERLALSREERADLRARRPHPFRIRREAHA